MALLTLIFTILETSVEVRSCFHQAVSANIYLDFAKRGKKPNQVNHTVPLSV